MTHIIRRLGPAVVVQDETQGFKFFDNRDLWALSTAPRTRLARLWTEAVVIGDEDPAFAGGSYVIVQKYLHDMSRWEAMPVEQQERIIGRHKLSDIEYPDAEKASYAHNVLTNIEDAEGNQLEILRDNMPFGSAAHGEFGTYFIGYAREPGRIETMLNNMFVGDPPGNYDRILGCQPGGDGMPVLRAARRHAGRDRCRRAAFRARIRARNARHGPTGRLALDP